MKWEELAYSLLEARPNDAVKLALAVAEGKPPNLKGADLRALVELEVKPGGGVRVELMDKGAALGAILKAGLPQDGDPEAVARFFAAQIQESSMGPRGPAPAAHCPGLFTHRTAGGGMSYPFGHKILGSK